MPIVRGKTIDVLFDAEIIAERNLGLAAEIAANEHTDLIVIAILKGSFIFAADLIRAMHSVGLEPEVEFISVSSYGAGTTGGKVKLLRDIQSDVKGRSVLLIDDILESREHLEICRRLDGRAWSKKHRGSRVARQAFAPQSANQCRLCGL